MLSRNSFTLFIKSFFNEANLLYRSASSQANSSNVHHDIYWWNSNITSCFRHGNIDTARQLFDEMPRKNLVTWNCMISGYVRNRKISEALQVFDAMPNRNIVSWTALLTGYAKCGRLEEARDLFEKMPEKNVICWNSMISGYINNGRIEKARELFNDMPTRNPVSWAIMIEGYIRFELVSEAQELFERADVQTTSVYNAMLSGYVEMGYLDRACQLFNGMPQRDVASWTTMITCYSRAGQTENARALFEEMPERDVAAWTALIRGYLHNGNIKDACKLFNDMPHRDIVAWNSMIGGFVENGMLEDAVQLFMQMPKRDIVSWNSILHGYVQQDDIVSAQFFFEKMPRRDGTSWNIMISAYRTEEALFLYFRMVHDGCRPDQGTFTSIVSLCGDLSILAFGRVVHVCIIKTGYEHDTMVVSSLITMYSKCGLINDASRVFDRMKKQDTVAWNAMIVAKAYHGWDVEALELYPSMIQSGFEPDHVTFLGLLTACAHRGLVDKGRQYFNSMEKDWELIPKPEHFSCMVDLLGRSGLLIEAYNFVKERHVDLPSYAWETLLSACRVHGNLKLGELVAKEILNSQPENGVVYVLLSNIYAARGMWEGAAGLRALMKCRGAKKELSCSWIELQGRMSAFGCNDRSHAQMEDIHNVLETLSVIIEEVGWTLYI